VAEAGNRGRQAFQQSQAAIAASQQQAVQGALQSGLAQSVAPEGQQQLAGMIQAPGNTRIAGLGFQEQAFANDAYKSAGAIGEYLNTQRDTILPGMLRELEEELAAKAAGGGGGRGGGGGGRGGGGRGGGGSGSLDDYTDLFKADFGTTDKGKVNLFLSKQSRGYGEPGLPKTLRTRQYAAEQYGVPQELLEYYVPETKFFKKAKQGLEAASKQGLTAKTFNKALRTSAQAQPGDQRKAVRYFQEQAKATLPPPKQKKAKKKGR
jgi:hypothetical protein